MGLIWFMNICHKIIRYENGVWKIYHVWFHRSDEILNRILLYDEGYSE